VTLRELRSREAKGDIRIVREGVVSKKGGKVQNWKVRYSILTAKNGGFEGEIYYYEKSEGDIPPNGVIVLGADCSVSEAVIPGKDHTFAIYTKGRIWEMCCDSEADSREWVRAIAVTINGLSPADAAKCFKCTAASTSRVMIDGSKRDVCAACALDVKSEGSSVGETNLRCSICDLRFKDKNMLTKHAGAYHNASGGSQSPAAASEATEASNNHAKPQEGSEAAADAAPSKKSSKHKDRDGKSTHRKKSKKTTES